MHEKERILRLLTYKGILTRFKSLGFIKVFSDNIAEALDVSSSLVRKDFGIFGITGNQKGGYHIDKILDKINDIIGFSQHQKVIIVGMGRIGEALMNYKGFNDDGIAVVAGFDTDVDKIDESAEKPIYPIGKLQNFVDKNNVKIAIMSVPEAAAMQTYELLKSAGILGILNFTPFKIKSTDEIEVNHISIEHELTNLIYFVNNKQKQ